MLGYLELKKNIGGVSIEINKENKLGQYSPNYHKTVQQIFEVSENIDGIIIPDDLGSQYDYNVLLMIIHIRLFFDKRLSKLPICIYIDDNALDMICLDTHQVSERTYNDIGVSIIVDSTPPIQFKLHEIKEGTLDRFLRDKVGHPWFTEGRHDQANRWGPYVFLFVLNEMFGNNIEELRYVEDMMFEEPYLKRLSNKISYFPDHYHLISKLIVSHKKLEQQLKEVEHKRILVVEDKLKDGWKQVFEAVFCNNDLGIEIIWAQTANEALKSFNDDLAFVILDMRLSPDSKINEVPAGIKLAEEFRKKNRFVPVIVATASNKTWVLQKLTDQGIDAYWVKASPEIDTDFPHAIENVTDFYNKVISTLEWSQKTRDWIETLYHIAEQVYQNKDKNITIANRLDEKARSFHALLQRSFSPFSKEISDGLQQNLAFLIAYSCMNDLVSWVCTIKIVEDNDSTFTIWSTSINGIKKDLVRELCIKNENPVYEIQSSGKYGNNQRHNFPDNLAAQEVLMRYGLTGEMLDFQKISKIRNGLPLIHGKSTELGSDSSQVDLVKDIDLSCIINIMSTLVNKHHGKTA